MAVEGTLWLPRVPYGYRGYLMAVEGTLWL